VRQIILTRRLTTVLARWLLLAVASAALVAPQSLSRYVNSTDTEAVITVLPAERATYRIPRTIYGTFLEHIGASVFGGVSAQLLDNPSLETYPATPEIINQRFSAAAFRQSTRLNLPLHNFLRPAGRRYELRSDARLIPRTSVSDGSARARGWHPAIHLLARRARTDVSGSTVCVRCRAR
jgi:hypothetical protein